MEKTTYRGALRSVLLTKYHSGDETKKTEMDREWSTYGEEKWCTLGFGWGT